MGAIFKGQTMVFERPVTVFSKVYCYFALLNSSGEETLSVYFSTLHSCAHNS